MKMNVNQKGAVGLIEVIRDLTNKGFECFTPMHDYSAIDLIAINDEFKAIRLQVKYREPSRGAIEVAFRSMVNGKSVPINLDAIDGWAIYCPDVKSVVYINKSDVDLTKNGFSFRLEPGKPCANLNSKRKLFNEFEDIVTWMRG